MSIENNNEDTLRSGTQAEDLEREEATGSATAGGDKADNEPRESEDMTQNSDKGEEETYMVTATEMEKFKSQMSGLMEKLAIAEQVAKKEKERSDELNNHNARLQADFDNYRKRTLGNNKKLRDDGNFEVLEKIIPLIDVAEKAVSMIKDKNVATGMVMMVKQMQDILVSFGVEEIAALGEDFDPNYHNAVMKVDCKSEKDSGKVVEVFSKGYKTTERVLRHSVVKVAN